MSRLVYCAQPIDQASRSMGSPGSILAARTKTAARELGIALYQPARAFHTGDGSPDSFLQIDQINRAAIEACSGMVAILSYGTATLGVPAEIEQMRTLGRPVLIVVDDRLAAKSVQVAAWADLPGVMVATEDVVSDGLRWLRGALDEPAGIPVRVAPGAVLPNRAYADDAGFDLAATEDVTIGPLESALIPTGIGMAIPPGYFGLILGRSSAWAKYRVDVKLGVIDAGWRGDLFVSVHNPWPGRTVEVSKGDRLGQVLVLPVWLGPLHQVAELPPHERGVNGFGSSGQ